jgi:hypothetical protein
MAAPSPAGQLNVLCNHDSVLDLVVLVRDLDGGDMLFR